MRVLERLCPQTWWQWAIYAVMAGLLLLNIALANMQALDAAPQPHAHHTAAISPTTPGAVSPTSGAALETQPESGSRR